MTVTTYRLTMLAAALLLGAFPAIAPAADPDDAGYLSYEFSERILSATQAWGILGVDAAAHLPNATAAKLRIKDQEYAHGLGTHANSEIVVDLGGEFTTFQADAGVQWSGGNTAGSVVFQVYVDGRPAFDSGTMHENDPPKPANVPVQGANELRLVVGDAGDGITADSANWADARLTRDPAGAKLLPEPPVDIAPFALTLMWNPKVMEGTKASRSDEIPAEDIAPYKEVLPSADNTYTVPAADGSGCIGLQWDENRILRHVGLTFTKAMPPAASIQLQYWAGESAWQGKWQTVTNAPKIVKDTLTWTFGPDELTGGTQKVRWIFSDVTKPIILKGMSAFTRSRWKTVPIRIESVKPGSTKAAKIEAYNGAILGADGKLYYLADWDGRKPLLLKVRASLPRPYKADRTVLRMQFPDTAFGVAVEDLLANDCVYVPHAGLFVTRDPAPIAPDDYLRKIAQQKTMLEEVRQKPDQEFQRAVAVLHTPRQDTLPYGHTLISLACDNRKFIVERSGCVVFNAYNAFDDYPGASDGIHTIAANVNQWRFTPGFGDGKSLPVTRHPNGGWLPMPVITAQDTSVAYQQMTYVAPVGDAPAGEPAWLREQALCAIEYQVKNTGNQPADTRLSLKFTPETTPQSSVQCKEVAEGVVVTNGDRLLAFIDTRKASPLAGTLEAAGTILSGRLPAQGIAHCVVYLPAWTLAPAGYDVLLTGEPWAPRVESYWKTLLEPAMQIDIPDELLSNIIRASQVHCMLAARNENHSKYVVPWISSIHFAYPESEANSVIRGLDLTGHGEFAKRALEFYISKANPAGYITIIVANICGYTIVGTGEVLWTLGEHYQRTRDQAWMRKLAPDVARICQWVIRQHEKTKRLDARGRKAPEYGLAPPGVSADWNRFAYRFFNDAQYYRGLKLAGQALADVGDPAGPAILEKAEEYREDIVRAYHYSQARMPVVPLKNGAWAPADPSLVGCFGNVEDFMPGEDVSRSYCYSVEIGAHHLAVNEVLDPASKDADWMIDYLEDVQFLRSRWMEGPNKKDPFTLGGFAKMQPYYCRIAELYAQRDEVKPFIRSYFNPIGALLNFEDLTFWEDWNGGQTGGAWNKTHETGWFLSQTRTMFVTEHGDELWLAPFVTSQWLKDEMKVAIRNAPTRFGKVSYQIISNVAKGEVEAIVQLPENCTAKKVVLRLRHPQGKPIQSVTVQDKSHADFDPQKETITFVLADKTTTVRAKY